MKERDDQLKRIADCLERIEAKMSSEESAKDPISGLVERLKAAELNDDGEVKGDSEQW